jgi:hypothetical protein
VNSCKKRLDQVEREKARACNIPAAMHGQLACCYCSISNIFIHISHRCRHQGDAEKASVPYYRRCDRKFQLNDHNDVEPWNDLEPTTKLQWALQMAEAVMVLNNFDKGVM